MLNNFALDSIRNQYAQSVMKEDSKNSGMFDCNYIEGGRPAKVMVNDSSSTTTDDTHSLQSLDQQPFNECFFEDTIQSQNTVFIAQNKCTLTPTFQPTSSQLISASIPFLKSVSAYCTPIQIPSLKSQQKSIDQEIQQHQTQVSKPSSIAQMISSSPLPLNNNSKSCKQRPVYEDRFIPSRKHSKLSIALTLVHDENIVPQSQLLNNQESSNATNVIGNNNGSQCQVIHAVNQKDLCSQQVSIADLYKTQVLGIKPPETKFSKYEGNFHNRNILAFSSPSTASPFSKIKRQGDHSNIISENKTNSEMICYDRIHNSLFGGNGEENWQGGHYQMDPISNTSPHNFYSRQIFTHLDPLNGAHSNHPFNLNPDIKTYFTRNSRKISKIPFKVLDAPTLKDDFYLNLIDWGENNQIAVGLGSCVYLWSAANSRVTKLCDLRNSIGSNNQSIDESDNVTSVSWSSQGAYLSIGTNSGSVSIWDTIQLKKIKEYNQHRQRVGALSWNKNLLVSGSRDKKIIVRDIRSYQPVVNRLSGHKQEICGLKWSYDHQQLASGGNDNNLFVWNMHSSSPIIKLQSHTAAVKALSWSPHQHGLLISGGGSLDRTIRIWNTITREQIKCIDTGSQVCNLQFSKNRNEFVSTHGYSENQITIWNYPDLDKLAVLTGHTQRVLHLAMSPDGDTIATGAGDETLRFWNINDSQSKEQELQSTINKSQLLPQKNYLR